jgi:2-hydroxy-3-oxopropionate reductase
LPHVEKGATEGANPADVGRRSRVVFLCLPDAPDVEGVLFGPDGLAEGLRSGSIVVDTSTISATSARAFAKRLAASDVAFLDAPISGGQEAAEQGTLSCMVGGERDVLEACRPLFECIAKNIVYVGASGAGQICKTCNQIAVTGAMLGIAEAIALAVKQGIDPMVVRDALLGGSAKSVVLERHGKRLIERTFEPGFRSVLMRKDLRVALKTGQDQGVFMPTTALALQLLEALCNSGRAELDWSSLGALVQELSGIQA